jgi:hypothetical protein
MGVVRPNPQKLMMSTASSSSSLAAAAYQWWGPADARGWARWGLALCYVVATLLACCACVLLRKHRKLAQWTVSLAVVFCALRCATLCVPPSAGYAAFGREARAGFDGGVECVLLVVWLVVFLLSAQSALNAGPSSSRQRDSLRSPLAPRGHSLDAEAGISGGGGGGGSGGNDKGDAEASDGGGGPTFLHRHTVFRDTIDALILRPELKRRAVAVCACVLVPAASLAATLIAVLASHAVRPAPLVWASLARGAGWLVLQIAFGILFTWQLAHSDAGRNSTHAAALCAVGDAAVLPVLKACLTPFEFALYTEGSPVFWHEIAWLLFLLLTEIIPIVALIVLLSARAGKQLLNSSRW